MGALHDTLHTSAQLTPVAALGAALVVTVGVVAASRLVSADAHVNHSVSSTFNASDNTSSSADAAQSQSSSRASDDQNTAAQTEPAQDTTEIHTSVVSSSDSSGQSTVTVNGTQYTAPAGSSMHHSEVSDDGQTRIDVNINNQNTSGTSQSTHTNINSQSFSSTTQYHSGGQ